MKNGGTAFPCNSPDGVESYKGMTLRDYFASQALNLIRSNGNVDLSNKNERNSITKAIAMVAYEVADAMLAEREKNE